MKNVVIWRRKRAHSDPDGYTRRHDLRLRNHAEKGEFITTGKLPSGKKSSLESGKKTDKG